MALGARQTQVLGLVLREGAALIAVGTAMGLAGAFLLARMLSALTSVFVSSLEIGATDLRLLIGAPVLLAALALGACYIPARRAAKTDPLITLRQG
jgi:ABC-type antimicrobial peptide transport system permease subunit